jgi:hypothetical protein
MRKTAFFLFLIATSPLWLLLIGSCLATLP